MLCIRLDLVVQSKALRNEYFQPSESKEKKEKCLLKLGFQWGGLRTNATKCAILHVGLLA